LKTNALKTNTLKLILKNARPNMAVALLLLAGCPAFAQRNATPEQKAKRPSPPATAQCKFSDGKTITVDYSQPSMKGRKIYGGLVPYDQVWRTGANEATTFVTTADLTVFNANPSNGERSVPKGSYTLYTIPSKDAWKLIISKKTGQWGIPYPGEQEDLARVSMKTEALEVPVEQFLISFRNSDNACVLLLDWEKTRAYVYLREQNPTTAK